MHFSNNFEKKINLYCIDTQVLLLPVTPLKTKEI